VEGSALYSRVHDGDDMGAPSFVKVSDEMRLCAFTDLESIYLHHLEEDKLLVKVLCERAYPVLLHCLPSSDRKSLDIIYLTDMNEERKVGHGEGNEIFIRETVSLENLNR
jgi:hypothetical protein